ncbi:MAG: HEAT repeat domain-containing protein [Candidatus Sumerlaeota bacterium]|nr:HEAT repeat domain-containing protein [Candidatus Sumerlaeota bacterium]
MAIPAVRVYEGTREILTGPFELRGRSPQQRLEQFKPVNMIGVTRCAYQLLESQYETMRLKAARLLGDLRSPMGIGSLIQALKDSSRAVRKAAANALGRIGGGEAAEALTAALFDPNSDIQPPAARALGRIGGAQSLKALMANLLAQSPRALGETIDSLARIGDSAAILPLICLFHQVQDESLRQRIAAALGKLGQTESLDEVMNSLQGIQGKTVGN